MKKMPKPDKEPKEAPKRNPLEYDKFFNNAFTDGSIAEDFDCGNVITSSSDLLKLDGTEQRYLLYPLIPRCGTGILAGQPDCGKSRLSGHLALCIALGLPDFLEFQLHTTHKRVLIVCTEDDAVNTSFLLHQQLKGLGVKEVINLHYIFSDTLSQHEVLLAVDEFLLKFPCDLVLFDAFADLFIGQDSNSNQAMRLNVRNFNYFAQKHQSFFLFVHHTTKASFKQAPNQNHILGAGGLAQKCRFAWMLSQGENNLKFLTVVKGNFCPREYKVNSIELLFKEKTFLFSRTGREIPIDLLNTEENKSTQLDKLQKLAEEIFQNEAVTYKVFCERHCAITGKAIASARRDHKLMKELEMIFIDDKKWALNS